MILPAGVSSLLQSLNVQHEDERLSQMHQAHNNKAANINHLTQGVQQATNLQKTIGALGLQAVINNLQANLRALKTNASGVRNRSLETERAALYQCLGLKAINKRSDEHSDSQDIIQDYDEELSLIDLVLKVKHLNSFSSFLLISTHIKQVIHNNKTTSVSLVVIAPLAENNAPTHLIDLKGYSIFAIPHSDGLGENKVLHLPAQVVSGSFAHNNDWLSIRFEKIYSPLNPQNQLIPYMFQVSSQNQSIPLLGKAALVGKSDGFANDGENLSLHIPELSAMQKIGKIPSLQRPTLEEVCSRY